LQITVDVLDGGLEHIKLVAQRVQLPSRDHKLAFAEAEFCRPEPGFVVALATAALAVQARAPDS
jgi:hypothetical protein